MFPLTHCENRQVKCDEISHLHPSITLFSNEAFTKYLNSIKAKINGKQLVTENWKVFNSMLAERNIEEADDVCKKAQAKLREAKEVADKLKTFEEGFLAISYSSPMASSK